MVHFLLSCLHVTCVGVKLCLAQSAAALPILLRQTHLQSGSLVHSCLNAWVYLSHLPMTRRKSAIETRTETRTETRSPLTSTRNEQILYRGIYVDNNKQVYLHQLHLRSNLLFGKSTLSNLGQDWFVLPGRLTRPATQGTSQVRKINKLFGKKGLNSDA
jgi:hypothetical protein